ncbi:MAG: AtpZ/AtpI family protein [Planctomycetes bacterium]|nr:AtpZ/AtpI family protein [Planctomycetota bacterium]
MSKRTRDTRRRPGSGHGAPAGGARGSERGSDRSLDRGTDAIAASLTFAAAVGLFAWLGHRADASFGTRPWLLVSGSLLGVVGGFLHLVQHLSPESLPWNRSPPRRDVEGPPGDSPARDAPGPDRHDDHDP